MLNAGMEPAPPGLDELDLLDSGSLFGEGDEGGSKSFGEGRGSEERSRPSSPMAGASSPSREASKVDALQSELEALKEELRKLKTKDKVPHLKLNPPSLFSGKRGSWEFFSSKLHSYATLTKVPETELVALAVQQLDERPTKVWEAHKKKLDREGTAITWEVFHKFMSSRYDSSDLVTQARTKLDKVYQGTEGVERYIERFMSLLADVETNYDICEQDKIHLFLKGLETQLKLACTVNPSTGKPFEELDTLCTYVVRYETSLKSTGGAQRAGQDARRAKYNSFRVAAAAAPVMVQPQPFGFQLAALQPTGKVDSRTSIPADRQCYFCKELGHEAWACKKKKEYLTKRAAQHKHHPVHYQPGHYPHGLYPPVAAPVVPWSGYQWGPLQGGVGKGKGRRGKNGKGKGKGPQPPKGD